LHWAERAPDAVFLTELDRGRAATYGEVAGAVACFRAELRRLGVSRGDRVAVLADNGVGWVVAYLGAIAHGAVAALLNTRQAAGGARRHGGGAGGAGGGVRGGRAPRAPAGDPPYLARISGKHRRGAIVASGIEMAGRPATALDGSEARPDEVGILCYTSGTTG